MVPVNGVLEDALKYYSTNTYNSNSSFIVREEILSISSLLEPFNSYTMIFAQNPLGMPFLDVNNESLFYQFHHWAVAQEYRYIQPSILTPILISEGGAAETSGSGSPFG